MRKVQGPKPRGSQHWLQVLANHSDDILEHALERPSLGAVRWLSPIQSDDFAEYSDQAFLDRVGAKLVRLPLESFWPKGGPVWDGLALTSSGAVLMVEAKANLPELESPSSQAREQSASVIRRSLARAKPSFGAPATAEWMRVYYQYANRLAWLHFLRAENAVDAYLVFLYFVGASEVAGPTSESEWEPAIELAHQALELHEGPLSPFVLNAFVNVQDLADA